MSSYYVNNSQTQPPTGMHFSSWDNSGSAEPPPPSTVPEPPMRYVDSQPPADPNATRLVREHFRTARDNALANTVPVNPAGAAVEGDIQNWWLMLVVGVIVIAVIGGCVYAGQSSGAPAHGHAAAFGSGVGNLSSGLLNDLEFL